MAIVGSMRIARRAGIADAARATSVTASPMAAKVTGSRAGMSNRRVAINLDAAHAVTSPPTMPLPAQSRGSHTSLYAVGRLKPGVDVTSARAEMQNIAAAPALEYPGTNKGSSVYIVPLADRVIRDMAPTLTVLAGAVACCCSSPASTWPACC